MNFSLRSILSDRCLVPDLLLETIRLAVLHIRNDNRNGRVVSLIREFKNIMITKSIGKKAALECGAPLG